MRKTIISLALTAATALTAEPQATVRYDLHKYEAAGSSYEADRPATYDIGNTRAYAMYRHPALVGLAADTVAGSSALVQAMYSNGNIRGDYLHYSGNHTSQGGVMAGGEMYVKGIGTLYGHAYYGRDNLRSVYQNYAVRPEDYAPYFVADSLGTGDMSQEHYLLEGGLSMRHHDWRYGIGMLYEGIDGSKDTQPRRAVYSYWFRLALSAARVTPEWILSAKVWPEINKQSISASSSVQTFRVLQFYGFGQWNRKESATGYSYARDNKILGAGGELLFSTGPMSRRKWSLTACASYNYRRLTTEETSFKNLFLTTTGHLNHTVALSGHPRDAVGIDIVLTGEETFRSGEENVYERRRQDEDQSLYDYVKAGTNRLYHRSGYTETLLAKATWHVSPLHSLSLVAGAAVDWYKEEYDMPAILVENRGLTPQGGVGYVYTDGRNTVDFEFTGSCRTALDNRFALSTAAPTQFETAQAYIPYLLRGEDRWTLRTSLIGARDIKYGQLGICVNASYGRRTGAPYVAGWQPCSGTACSRFAFDVMAFFMF